MIPVVCGRHDNFSFQREDAPWVQQGEEPKSEPSRESGHGYGCLKVVAHAESKLLADALAKRLATIDLRQWPRIYMLSLSNIQIRKY